MEFFASSRELLEIKACTDTLEPEFLPVDTRSVDADIAQYVSSELSRDRKLDRLDGTIKTFIMETFAEKADGL